MNVLLLYSILLPAAFAVPAFLLPGKGRSAALLLGSAGNLALAMTLYGRELRFARLWGGFGLAFSLRFTPFGGLFLLAAAALAFFVAVYTVCLAKDKPYAKMLFSGMLLTLALANGAMLANNLLLLLFFWEGILGTMLLMLLAGGRRAHGTAIKALVIAGATDLCMMLGIILTGSLAQTLDMDHIRLPLDSGWGIAAFALLVIGAVSKAGAMPFHTWIPDAANHAPTPFLPFMPGALEKLLGIYLLTRLCGDLFEFEPDTPASLALMALGACTILFAVMMALIQRDFKRLLAYHAVSQVGYMILGLGSALPIGMLGGQLHMFNNAVYKCCLFLVAGAVERQCGTTDLNKLGGLGKKMPVTMACFLVAAASIAGFPGTNGFFSKELIFDAALESNLIFYIIAAVGAFFTAVSFLKLGHAVFFGKPTQAAEKAKEAPAAMLGPMLVLAVICLSLGFAESKAGHTNWLLAGISLCLLLLAALDHYLGFKKTGKGLEAADHFHHAPGLRTVYAWAEKKYFDPYELARGLVGRYARLALRVNDGISRCYDVLIPRAVGGVSSLLRRAHTGDQSLYVLWVLGGLTIIAVLFLLV